MKLDKEKRLTTLRRCASLLIGSRRFGPFGLERRKPSNKNGLCKCFAVTHEVLYVSVIEVPYQ